MFKQNKCNYFVWNIAENTTLKACLELMGFEFITEVESYSIFYFHSQPENDIKVAQFSDVTGNNAMFYAMTDVDGHVCIVDGGNPNNAEYMQDVIKYLGSKVDLWILTHPHADHIGAFCTTYGNTEWMEINRIITVDMAPVELCKKNASWDDMSCYETFLSIQIPQLEYVYKGQTIDFYGIRIDILSAYDDYVDELSSDLINDGSMMFKVYGEEESMLFCADIGISLSDYLKSEYGDILKSEYLQMGHHGNGGLSQEFYRLVNPKVAFFDAPEWLMFPAEGSKYTTPANRQLMESMGSYIAWYGNTPNVITIQ